MRLLIGGLFLLGSICTPFAYAEKPLLTLFTAVPNGTYHEMGQDIAKACNDFKILVEPSAGSIENINLLTQTPVTTASYRFALVQKDVLHILPERIRSHKIQEITQLFNEEIVIVVNRKSGIATVTDLKNKKVSIGLAQSGNWVSANIIKHTLKLNWTSIEKTASESILEVLTGEIDALILTAGTPNKILADISGTMRQHIRILPVAPMLDIYAPAEINAGVYDWHNTPVETISTYAILISAQDVPHTVRSSFLKCIKKNLGGLQKFGHPKWKEVKLSKRIKNE